jgi:hypothetical protein
MYLLNSTGVLKMFRRLEKKKYVPSPKQLNDLADSFINPLEPPY